MTIGARGRLRVLDLFSGIGGFSLGLERAGMQTVAFCEIEPYCRAVLRKHWPGVPIFEDVRALHGTDVPMADVICGGFPCQPTSVAGKRLGSGDPRWLWPEYFRLIKELRPSWIVGENTPGIISMGLDGIADDLEGEDYQIRAFNIPACAVGADHERQRIWIIAHTDRVRELQLQGRKQNEPGWAGYGASPQTLADIDGARLQERFLQPGVSRETGRYDAGKNIALDPWWKARPNLVRGVYGVPGRVDRVRALGNAVVPQIPEMIGRAILEAECQ